MIIDLLIGLIKQLVYAAVNIPLYFLLPGGGLRRVYLHRAAKLAVCWTYWEFLWDLEWTNGGQG